jgi:hypothetical protein
VFVLLLASACIGTVKEGPPTLERTRASGTAGPNPAGGGAPGARPTEPAGSATAPPEESAAPSWIRRLSAQEIGNAVEDIVGFRPAALAQLPRDKQDYSYDRVAQAQTVTAAHLEAFTAIAEEIAAWLTPPRLATLVRPCAAAQPLAADGPELASKRRPCVEALVDQLGPRVLRRPLAAAKRAALLSLYAAAGSYSDGLRMVVQGLFSAPEFLYVIEEGKPVPGRAGLFALDDGEIATRLSLFLCETVPDPPLLAAAAAGALHLPEQIAGQAERLFDLPCARRAVARFFKQWLKVEKVAGLVRDTQLFPRFDESTRLAMAREQERFTEAVVWGLGGRLADLFTAAFTFVDRDLAPLYDLAFGDDQPHRVELPPQRRGLLTQPSLLAVTSTQRETSPVQRGAFVLKELLCQTLPRPPDELNVSPPVEVPDTTTRSRWERHSADPACSVCHQLIDPIGFAMEDFDPIGRYRTTDGAQPVNSTGGLPLLGIASGKLQGAAQVGAAIAGSQELAACFARQWLRFGLGRLDGPADARALWDLGEGLRAPTPLRSALLSLARTFAFRHRAAMP